MINSENNNFTYNYDNTKRHDLLFLGVAFVIIIAVVSLLVTRLRQPNSAYEPYSEPYLEPYQQAQYQNSYCEETGRDNYRENHQYPIHTQYYLQRCPLTGITKSRPAGVMNINAWNNQHIHIAGRTIRGTVSRDNWVYFAEELFVGSFTAETGHRAAIERISSTGQVQQLILLENLEGWLYGFGISEAGNFQLLIGIDRWQYNYFGHYVDLVVLEYDRNGNRLSSRELTGIEANSQRIASVIGAVFMKCGNLIVHAWTADWAYELIYIFDPQNNLAHTLETDWGRLFETSDNRVLFFGSRPNDDLYEINPATATLEPAASYDMPWRSEISVFNDTPATFPDGRVAVFTRNHDTNRTNINILSPPGIAPLCEIEEISITQARWRDPDPRAIFTLDHHIDGATAHNGNIYYWYVSGTWNNQSIVIHQVDETGQTSRTTTIEWPTDCWLRVGDISFTQGGNFLVLVWGEGFELDTTIWLKEYDARGNHVATRFEIPIQDMWPPMTSSIAPDGSVIAIFHGIDYDRVTIFNPQGQQVGEHEIGWSTLHIDGNRFFIETDNEIREINLQTGQISDASNVSLPSSTDWEALGFDMFYINAYVSLPGGSLAVFYWVDMGSYLGTALIISAT